MRLFWCCLLFTAINAKHEKYEGYKSFYAKPANYEQLVAFHQIAEKHEVDVLASPTVQREGVVIVKPEFLDGFLQELSENKYNFRIHQEDVKKTLDTEDEIFEERRKESFARNGGRYLPFEAYHNAEVYNEYMMELAEAYPETVTLVTPGNSYEGRPVYYLKISTTNFEDTTKPVICIDGGIHPREWISPPTVAWAMHKLIVDITEEDLLENYDWILLPVVNPDGYEYSLNSDAFWRKTRSREGTFPSTCPGVNGNRNYDVFWNTAGTSNFQCSDIYSGPNAFSEVETIYVRDIMFEHLDRIALYLTMHSYGSLILYPWGHNGVLSTNWVHLHRVADAMGRAIDNATNSDIFPDYIVGNSALTIGYIAAGTSEDYAHYIGVPLSFTYELPGLTDGFHLDTIHIEQVCTDTWAGIVSGAREAYNIWNRPL